MNEDKDNSDLLDAVRASIRIGASPELLFHYARRDTVTVNGPIRLASRTVNGKTVFSLHDLDEFDRLLDAARNTPNEPRSRIDLAVTSHLKAEAGGACARCSSGITVENAHIIPYRETQSNHHRNLVRLCSACHGEYDTGVVSRMEIEALKLRLVEAARDRLLAAQGVNLAPVPVRHELLGRAAELEQLVAALQSPGSVMVRGVGGIGKTQLVLAAADAAQTGRPLIWISLQDCPSAAVLAAYLETAAGRIGDGDFISTLSSVRACVILDGVERAACGLDIVSDMIARLSAERPEIQLVVTSQARLPEVGFDFELELGPLDHDSAVHLFPEAARSEPAASQLLQFAAGHPLTLRIIAGLVRHFEGAEAVWRRLTGPGQPLEMPARSVQTSASSLDLCLEAAFTALTSEQQKAMWVIAQFPAGLSTLFFDLESLGFEDPPGLIAALRQWHLVEVGTVWDEPLLSTLSPVRHFVRHAGREAAVPDQEVIRRRTAYVFAMRVAEANSMIHSGKIAHGMALLHREFPNALAIMDHATGHAASDPRYRMVANALASNLQTFLFSAGYFEVGAEVMRKAADLALAAGAQKEALEMLSQLISLANRGKCFDLASAALADARSIDCRDDEGLRGLLLGIEAGAETRPRNSRQGGGHDTLLEQAAAASRSYDLLTAAAGGTLTHRGALALLQQACLLEDAGNPAEALALLDRICPFFIGASNPINAGAALQRRGNCLAYVGRVDEAMENYADSAVRFHPLGAVDYRSNTLGEAGLLMAEYHAVSCSQKITCDIVVGGVDDIVDRIVTELPGIRVPGNDWPYVLTRKTCGLIAIASLGRFPEALNRLGDRLRSEVADMMFAQESEEARELDYGSPVAGHFAALAWLCEHVSAVEPADRYPDLAEVEGLAIVVEDMFRGGVRELMFGWLARYLSQQRGMTGLRPGILRAAVDGLSYGEPFELDGFSLAL
ncbi:hypothetical protein [Sphingopyxis sp. QXT-31]|uniref:hypothetical protein n=1 Tax=Sphingopyxis sp. QXT-31 TaxID=1357916 RepID=UPI0012EC72BA|nr:hypothetical protein [Sphingopyxis sp. QXT-31]